MPLLFDEVYTGFRMAPGGAQEYYGVDADVVVYGKTLGGGLANGVVCGPARLMQRFDPTRPLRVAYVGWHRLHRALHSSFVGRAGGSRLGGGVGPCLAELA